MENSIDFISSVATGDEVANILDDVIKKIESGEILLDSPFPGMMEPWSDEQMLELNETLNKIFGFKNE